MILPQKIDERKRNVLKRINETVFSILFPFVLGTFILEIMLVVLINLSTSMFVGALVAGLIVLAAWVTGFAFLLIASNE